MSVIINGGGVSGAILALILSKLVKSLEINLIEVFPSDQSNFSNSPRYIALSRGSYYRLMSFFDTPCLLFSCAAPIKTIEVSSSIRQNRVVFSSSDYHILALGYVVALDDIKIKIFNVLQESSFVNLFCPATLKRIKREQFNNIVVLDNGAEITGQLLIAADGSYSSLATLCGMQWFFFDYHQTAVVTTVTTSLSNEGRAFEIFTTSGSLAILPVSENRSSLIWCVPTSYKKEISDWNTSEFCHGIQKIFGWKLGCISDADKRCFFPLFLRKANQHISHRLALVGNAAQTLHPIAGQGFNLGLRDVLNISEVISESYVKNIDVGDYATLKLYQKRRQSDQSRIINMTHGLVRLFNNSSCSFTIFREFVLAAMKRSKFLRTALIKTILSW